MDKQQALEILSQCAAKYVGTLADHQALQAALEVFKAMVSSKSEPSSEVNE